MGQALTLFGYGSQANRLTRDEDDTRKVFQKVTISVVRDNVRFFDGRATKLHKRRLSYISSWTINEQIV